jgi:hypothetical protein
MLACNWILSVAAEPNQPESRVKIKISDQPKSWVRNYPGEAGVGPIKPRYVAELFVLGARGVLDLRKASSGSHAAGSMSREQLDFLDTCDAFAQMGSGQIVRNHDHFLLYAVSEADARRMIEGFIEILGERPRQIHLQYVDKLRGYQEEMAKAKGLLPGKEALLLTVKAEYDKSKEYAHAFSADTEAAEQAKQTIVEMGKMLDTLDVELAGIREKLNVINDYWSKRGEMSEAARGKLQEMEIEQMVELKGAEARRKAAVGIRQREKDFLDLFDQWLSLDSEVKGLRSTIDNRQEHIAEYEAILANPKPDMLPPKIYENKVVIYPVQAD